MKERKRERERAERWAINRHKKWLNKNVT